MQSNGKLKRKKKSTRRFQHEKFIFMFVWQKQHKKRFIARVENVHHGKIFLGRKKFNLIEFFLHVYLKTVFFFFAFAMRKMH